MVNVWGCIGLGGRAAEYPVSAARATPYRSVGVEGPRLNQQPSHSAEILFSLSVFIMTLILRFVIAGCVNTAGRD